MIQLMWMQAYAMATSLVERLDSHVDRTERGDVSEKTVTIATMVALALAVGGIITAAVMAAANKIKLN